MENYLDQFVITDDIEKLDMDVIVKLLNGTYWGRNWSYERIRNAMDHSICFGVFLDGKQIAYARCVTDYATMYWLCDVVVEERYRNQGIASKLIDYIISHKTLKHLMGILSSNHSKDLYSRFGFKLSTNGFMIRPMPKEQPSTFGG